MSIIRIAEDYVIRCDECGVEMADEHNFAASLIQLKKHNWRSVQVDGVWYDYCGKCFREKDVQV